MTSNKLIGLLFFPLFFLVVACSSNNSQESTKKEANTPQDSTAKEETKEKKHILFFGNSLTAGYGLEMSQAFPALIQAKIDSLLLPYFVTNAGLSGETTESGNTRIDWMLNQKIDVLVLELGGNDGLRGISPDLTKKNLQSIIDKTRKKYPQIKIVLAGMEAPPNMGEKFTNDFRKIYKELATTNQLSLIPFLLEGVGGEPKLNLPDGIHPTPEGHKIVAETIWKTLKEVIE
ncbi:MAG: arylesterase [Thermoflexibacter sp.]|jgi:acyl-CoA thioesterase-1|nr:arylesterase [Thermoflexibacter sp.]